MSVPPGHSSPVVSKESIFLTSFHEGRVWTHCFDVASGKEAWRRAAPVEKVETVHEYSSPAAPTPACDGERVYVYFGDYGVIAYDYSGREVWSRALPKPQNVYGIASSPALISGKLVIARFGSTTNSSLLALNPETGANQWETVRAYGPMNQSTPVCRQAGGRQEIVAFGGSRVSGFDLQTGEERWFATDFPSMVIGVPALAGELVFVGGSGVAGNSNPRLPFPTWVELAKRFDTNQDGRITDEEVPEDFYMVQRPDIPPGEPGHGVLLRPALASKRGTPDGYLDGATYDERVKAFEKSSRPVLKAIHPEKGGELGERSIKWSLQRGIPEMPSPLFYEGRLYLIRNGGLLKCLRPADGTEVYDVRVGAGGQYAASPVAADGRIYLCSDTGTVTVLRAGDEFQVLGRTSLQERITATPALVGSRIYIRSRDSLWAFGSR